MPWIPFISLLLACGAPAPAAPVALVSDNPVELGRIGWRRGFEAARQEAAARGLPLLVLFDEVPGCSTVRAFGAGALSHPLLVDAAESLFVPVVVYNNVAGADRATLEAFGEPAWNNPVVRILGPDGHTPLAPRLVDDWTEEALARTMVAALGPEAPPWLQVFSEELTASRRGSERAVFAMSCFWSGEAALGRREGVVATRTGFADGREVVEVTYDPRVTSVGELDGPGPSHRSSARVRGSDADDRYHLARTGWARVPMTPGQAARANAAVARGEDPGPWFSPRQHAVSRAVAARPEAPWPGRLGREDFVAAMDAALGLASR